MGVLTSFLAREVFVSSMSVVLVGDPDAEAEGVTEKVRQARRDDGSPVFTPATAASLLIFFALAMQCLPTLALTRRETGHAQMGAPPAGLHERPRLDLRLRHLPRPAPPWGSPDARERLAFWATTAAMCWGVATLWRQMIPRKGQTSCGARAAGAAACSKPKAPALQQIGSPLRIVRDLTTATEARPLHQGLRGGRAG